MNNFKYKLYQFMSGRYGRDALNSFLMIFVIIGLLLNAFLIHSNPLSIGLWLLIILYTWRMYSKNISKRRQENEAFLKITKPIRKRISLLKKQQSDKNNKYFLCPTCQQIIRVPKGRGKITITCPTCKNHFDKKS